MTERAPSPVDARERPLDGHPRRASAAVAEWIRALLLVVRAPGDCPTIDAWATLAGVSRTTLCGRCRLVGASPRDSLAFARLARTILASDGGPWRPEDLLDTLEERTLVRVLTRGGLLDYRHQSRPPLHVLFTRHRFVLPRAALEDLYRALAHPRRTGEVVPAVVGPPHRC